MTNLLLRNDIKLPSPLSMFKKINGQELKFIEGEGEMTLAEKRSAKKEQYLTMSELLAFEHLLYVSKHFPSKEDNTVHTYAYLTMKSIAKELIFVVSEDEVDNNDGIDFASSRKVMRNLMNYSYLKR